MNIRCPQTQTRAAKKMAPPVDVTRITSIGGMVRVANFMNISVAANAAIETTIKLMARRGGGGGVGLHSIPFLSGTP